MIRTLLEESLRLAIGAVCLRLGADRLEVRDLAGFSPTVAAVDRLVDHSTILQISGESYRRKRARQAGRPAAKG